MVVEVVGGDGGGGVVMVVQIVIVDGLIYGGCGCGWRP